MPTAPDPDPITGAQELATLPDHADPAGGVHAPTDAACVLTAPRTIAAETVMTGALIWSTSAAVTALIGAHGARPATAVDLQIASVEARIVKESDLA